MDYHGARRFIKEQGVVLTVGQSKRMRCPVCEAVHEKSLMVTNRGDSIAYICPRAKCSLGGSVISLHGVDRKEATRASRTNEDDTTPHEALPSTIQYWLQERYELPLASLQGWKYAPGTNALVLPIKDRYGRVVGNNYKGLPDSFLLPGAVRQASKSNIVMTHIANRLHYPTPLPTKAPGTVVVVEDQISAEKLSSILPTVALLGTHMSYVAAYELSQVRDTMVLMLDPDAYRKMMSITREYAGMFRRISLVFMDKDPKDTPWVELNRALNTYLA